MISDAGNPKETNQVLREIGVGVRVDPDEGLSSTGVDQVNGLINQGGKVLSIEVGGAVFRELGDDGENVSLTLSGCELKVIIDIAEVPNSPASQEHDRLYRAAYDLIKPYMQIVNRETKPANSEEARRELKQGMDLFKQVLKINPGNGSAWWIIGKAQQALENAEAACDAFGKAYRLVEDNPDTAREYMYECLKLGRTKQAIAAARHARRLKEDDMGLVANLALALLIGGELEEAAKTVEIALAGAPDDPISQNLKQRIAEVQSGLMPQPNTLADLDK